MQRPHDVAVDRFISGGVIVSPPVDRASGHCRKERDVTDEARQTPIRQRPDLHQVTDAPERDVGNAEDRDGKACERIDCRKQSGVLEKKQRRPEREDRNANDRAGAGAGDQNNEPAEKIHDAEQNEQNCGGLDGGQGKVDRDKVERGECHVAHGGLGQEPTYTDSDETEKQECRACQGQNMHTPAKSGFKIQSVIGCQVFSSAGNCRRLRDITICAVQQLSPGRLNTSSKTGDL